MISKQQVVIGLTLILRLSVVTLLASAAPDPADILALETQNPPEVLTLNGEVFHVQGLDLDDRFVYVSSVDRRAQRGMLHQFTRTGGLVASIDLTEGRRYHTSGFALDGDTLWIATAEYRDGGTTRISQINAATLQVISSFIVRDHIGAVAACGDRVYGVNWDARRIYVWDRAGYERSNVPNATRVAYQDLKCVDGTLVASGIARGGVTGAVNWLNPITLNVERSMPVARAESGPLWTNEGMALKGNRLYFLPEDGHDGQVQVYAFDLAHTQMVAMLSGD